MKHRHHIIPKHMGGLDDPSNIVKLTIKEHALAHKKLYEKYGKKEDYLAWKGLSGNISKEEILKQLASEMGKRNAHHMHTKAAIEKMRKSKMGTKLTKEHKDKISKSLMGRVPSFAHRQKTAMKLAMNFIVETPQGQKIEITNLREWATKNRLDQGNLTKVAQGKLKQHKGYKVSYKY